MNLERKPKVIDGNHNILRHVKGTQMQDEVVTSAAFELDVDEAGLSFGWIEYFSGSFDCQVTSTIAEFCGARNVRKSHRFARLNISKIKDRFVADGLKPPHPAHVPVDKIESHCEIAKNYLLNRIGATLLAEQVDALHNPILAK